MIWLSEYFDFFMQNLLRVDYEKILLITSVIFRGGLPLVLLVDTGAIQIGANKSGGGSFSRPRALTFDLVIKVFSVEVPSTAELGDG